ncbi:MAG: PSD1 domain-containing protein [Planctomycetes bacterium]|nr:PSD1 domain-containing protein [Planctomycetota bacterium]
MRKGLTVVALLLIARPGWAADKIDFNQQIRPILSRNCFACHGRDEEKREADLRLDLRAGATADLDGHRAIVPGKSGQSELYKRITSGDDDDERMPPPDSGKKLTAGEIKLLKAWIDGGAAYAKHWSLVPPVRPKLPAVNDKSWPKSPLDYFVLARLEAAGLKPSAEADRYMLIRRASLDLRGLPPTLEEIDAFVKDKSPRAYERLVDRLLASPRYGERWARVWLDLARYADTQGYEKDRPRTMWPWRDWVIKALNDDMPFDQFSVEQLAGDLLPGATSQQILATAFHRNTMTNTEGGTSDEEFRIAAVKDRIDTTGQIWLGMSVGCAKCHSHKYDPISQTEYYRLFAFFNQTADADRYNDAPTRSLPSPFYFLPHQELLKQIEAIKQQINAAGSDQQGAKKAQSLREKLVELNKQLDKKIADMKPPAVLVMQELPPGKQRKTHLLIKGSFLDHGDEVHAGVPEALHAMPPGAAKNRLGLARWLVDAKNPLVARVTVNRHWSRMFGVGLVETEEDFGTQGDPPSHPQLLDYLAVEFQQTHRWSLKKLCKSIVMSATYRQTSHVTPDRLQKDRRNRLLSRGPRFRLEAEMIRDQALHAGGLLSKKMYGPSVMPPQPDGTWQTVYNSGKWVTSKGEDRFRRGLYTYLKRTSPYPSFLLFDGGSGEVCMVRRIRTNTTTAALVTLNDPVYTEAAQALARRIVTDVKGDATQRSAYAWRRVTGRPGRKNELERIARLYREQLAHYRQHADAAKAMATDPLGPLPEGMNTAELAAWTVVAAALLNLDETLTKG